MKLESSLGEAGGRKSLMSILDEFHSVKDETRFEGSSALSIAGFSDTMELAKMMKEAGIGVNPKGEGEDSREFSL